MREILFRGKTKETNEMINGQLLNVDNKCYIINFDSETHLELPTKDKEWWTFFDEVIPKTIGQYTGLKDKNGTKIFEGDVLKTHHDSIIEVKDLEYIVLWRYENHYAFPKIKVTGNIHDKN